MDSLLVRNMTTAPITPNPEPAIRLDRPESNSWQSYSIVPQYVPSDPRSNTAISPGGAPGPYRITFIFAIPGKETFRDNIDWSNIINSGQSLLLTPGTSGFGMEWLHVESGTKANIEFFSNDRSELAKAQLVIKASNLSEALGMAHTIVLPMLSWWSVRYDTAIEISAYEVIEEVTGLIHISLGIVGQGKVLQVGIEDPGMSMMEKYRSIFAIYREAANSTNCFHKVLCLYKVVEAVGKLRTSRRNSLIVSGNVPTDAEQRIPNTLEEIPHHDLIEKHAFKAFLGKKFTFVIDHYRKFIRNAVAHLDPESESLSGDRFLDITKCMEAIPVIKYMAREMLRVELQLDPACKDANLIL
jgi:hypothetical protein